MIRKALQEDVPSILQMIRDLAAYEKALHEVVATEEMLMDSLFNDQPKVFCIVAIDNNDSIIVGMAIYFLNYSTWLGTHGIYLEDLYVKEQYRGKSYGKQMLSELAKICIQNKYSRLQWWVLNWNSPSIEFYKSIGAVMMDDWTVMRVSTEESLNNLARLA